jgi:hypothetical protein
MQESSAAPKRVLLAVWVRSHFREFFRIAAVLPGAGLQPVILFASGYTGLDEDMKACQSAGISCERAPRWLGRSHRLWSLARAPRFYRGLLSRWWPRCVVLGEDNVSYATGLLVRAAREFGAKSVVLPNTIPNVREPVETLSAHPKHHVRGLASSWVATRYPRWTCRHEDHSLLRLPPAAIVALEWLGGAPGNPWLLNSGGSDVIAVESNAMRAAYTAAGIQSSQIAVIGSPADDVLSGKLARIEEERRSLREKWRLNPARPIVLCAVPPDQFSKGRNAGGLGGFRDLLACLVRVLGNMAGCEILFTPHPRIAPEDAAFLKEQGARVLPGDTVEWVGLCDLYVASSGCELRSLSLPLRRLRKRARRHHRRGNGRF